MNTARVDIYKPAVAHQVCADNRGLELWIRVARERHDVDRDGSPTATYNCDRKLGAGQACDQPTEQRQNPGSAGKRTDHEVPENRRSIGAVRHRCGVREGTNNYNEREYEIGSVADHGANDGAFTVPSRPAVSRRPSR